MITMNTKLTGNDLYMLEHEYYGKYYFDSLYRAGEFLGCQRAQIEYALLKNRPFKGIWNVTCVDGSEIKWKDINYTHEKYEEIIGNGTAVVQQTK